MVASSWLRFSTALFVCGSLFFGFVAAQPGDTKKPSQPPFQLPLVLKLNAAPENVDDLAGIEKHVQKVIDKVTPAVVGIIVGPGSGSGVIVSEDGYVLTAGHVSGKPGQDATIILPNGTKLKGKTLGQNKGIDSGMIKIVTDNNKKAKFPYLDMGKSSDLKAGQWVLAIGHPGGFRLNRTPVVRVGRILTTNQFLIRTDCVLVGGDSGGPLFDMQGRVIGIHSRIGGKEITENVHVPVDTFRQTWDRLAKGESWGGVLGSVDTVRSAGGKKVFEKKDSLSKDDPVIPAPSDGAQKSHFKKYTFRMKAGHTYTIDLISKDKKGTKLDTFLKFESPDGKLIAEDDDGAGFPNARIVYKAIKEGDYRIIATSFDADQVGDFTLSIFEADFKDSVVSGQVELLKALRLTPPSVSRLLEEAAKAKVPLHINALLINEKGEPQANKEITIVWEKGKESLKSNNEGVVRWPLSKEKSKKLGLQIPNGLRAMVAVTDDKGTSLGIFSKDDPSVEKTKSAGGPIVKTFESTLKKSDPYDLERDKCYRHIHEFKMQVGKVYTLDLVSEDFDAYLRIETDEKGKLAEDDDSAGNNNARIVFSPPSTAEYRLVITSCDPGQTGNYRLVIREADAKQAEPKKTEKGK
jgi:S1-C subfamily serine protease